MLCNSGKPSRLLYTFLMPASAPPPVQPSSGRKLPGDGLWDRISEGKELGDLWSQFSADAQASYGFYGRDLDWKAINEIPFWKRPIRIAKQIFWALLMKLTPARRIFLFFALFLLVVSAFSNDVRYELIAALGFLFVLSLELADKVTMKRDLEIAREIQSWLVPSVAPRVPGANIAFHTRPQNSVAGDYYDAFYPQGSPVQGGKLFLAIADVAGKSVPAALLMATFQASLHTIARADVPLEELVTRINRYACAHSLDGLRFTTAVLAEYDSEKRRLSYVNAGHNAPVIRRRNAGVNSGIERLEVGGMPFGISPEATYQTGYVDLASQDALILFTDGVVEAFNQQGQEFTDGRWVLEIRNLPDGDAQRSLEFLLQRVDEFVGATRQFDDITCLVLRCE